MIPTPWLPWLPSSSTRASASWALKIVPFGGRGERVRSRGIPLHGHALARAGVPLGGVTSRSLISWLNRAVGLGCVGAEHAAVGAAIDVVIRGRQVAAPPGAPR